MNTKHFILIVLLLGIVTQLQSKSNIVFDKEKYTILLTGASFASPNNKWFELGCETLGATPLNRAVGGQAIVDAANLMAEEKLYTSEELEDIDALVIMHVHNEDVAAKVGLKKDFKDYVIPFDRSNYAAAYDYVIKKYIVDCYNLKFKEDSKYYNSPNGKPVTIVFCTHWHDARTLFNTTIRELADRWGFPVVEFDKYIGFSKEKLHPISEKQFSLLYARDRQTVDGVEYGWHPKDGRNEYIQQRMAAIFVDLMKKVLPLR